MQSSIIPYENEMYKFGNSFYLYLKKVNNYMIFAHYSLANDTYPNNQFSCEKIIFFQELKSIKISLNDRSNDKITVKVTFLNKDGNDEFCSLSGSHKNFYFSSFSQVAEYINLLTNFVYSTSLVVYTHYQDSEFNFDKQTQQLIYTLDEFEQGLLNLYYDTLKCENISVSDIFENGSLKYYYDVKIFDFANKKTWMSFEVLEGCTTDCTINFFNNPILLKSNYNNLFNNSYCIEILDTEDKKMFINQKLLRLSNEDYNRINPWIKEKLEGNSKLIL